MDYLRVFERLIKWNYTSQVELHLHGDGACRLETLKDLARKYDVSVDGQRLPWDDVEKFTELVALPRGASSLADFLKVFRSLDHILR